MSQTVRPSGLNPYRIQFAGLSFWKDKRVFLTGHTGFKGSWLVHILKNAGVELTGYALPPYGDENLYNISRGEECMTSIIGDIRDYNALLKALRAAAPDIVIHMAAQPLVGESYKNPLYTFETNIMGTANILECARVCGGIKSFLNVTTDKVYENHEWHWGYRETDALNGYDPYSNSKSCSDLVTQSYRNSFFMNSPTAVSTARAGNAIGGGDFTVGRIIPDCIKAARRQEPTLIRNPDAIRPYQHVLEPLFAYLIIAQAQYADKQYADCYNVGPEDRDCVTTGALADYFCAAWGDGASWESRASANAPHEAAFLKLDCSKLKSVLGWNPRWDIKQAVEKTVEWTRTYLNRKDITKVMNRQIKEYLTEHSR